MFDTAWPRRHSMRRSTSTNYGKACLSFLLRMLSNISLARLPRCQQRPIQTIFFIPLLNDRGLEVRLTFAAVTHLPQQCKASVHGEECGPLNHWPYRRNKKKDHSLRLL